MKKITAIAISVLLIVLTMVPCIIADAAAENFLVYDYDSANNAYKVKSCGTAASGELVIPSVHDGKPVNAIKSKAFDGCVQLTKITVPESVNAIESNAFKNCTGLEMVLINGSCTLGSNLFDGCTKLFYVKLPENITEITSGMFKSCASLTVLDIPASVTKIGSNAFSDCTSLSSMTISANVTFIGENALMNCTSLKKINVASDNKAYKSEDGVLFDKSGETLIQYPAGKPDEAYHIPEGVKTIGNSAFAKNSSIAQVIFSSDVKTVEEYAFDRCTALSSVELFNAATLKSMSFARCSSLKEIVIPASVVTYKSAFYQSGLEKVVIENGSPYISSKAFQSCTALSSINIPSSVTEIETGAFDGCTSLEELGIPATVVYMGNGVFNNCNGLTVTVEEGSYALSYAIKNSVNYKIGSTAVPSDKTAASVVMISQPAKTTFELGEKIDTAGASFKVIYNDGSSETTTGGFTVTPETATAAGKQNVTVAFGEKKVTYTITVVEPAPVEKTIAYIEVETAPDKTSYNYKDTLDTTGLTVRLIYTDGSSEVIEEGFTVDTTVLRTRGNVDIEVRYEEMTASFTVNVSFTFWQMIIYYLFLGFIWGY